MKRILSLLMLLLMLLVAIQPTVSMHFCGNNLQSVSVLNKEKVCCCTSNTQKEIAHKQINFHTTSCCSFHKVQLSTDDYQYQYQQSLQHTLFHSVDLMWFDISLQITRLSLMLPVTLKKYFPPEGLASLSRDILTSISILRI